LLIAALLAATGCASAKQITASSGDLADYRAYRVAAHRGMRLSRAQHYLEAHPNGAWSKEVKATFEEEEAAFYEEAKGSRDKAVEYLTALPRGPHAEAAGALLTSFDARDSDLAKRHDDERRQDIARSHATAARRKVGPALTGLFTALLDPAVYRARPEEPPDGLRKALEGTGRLTIGEASGPDGSTLRRRMEHIFAVPGQEGHLEDRTLVAEITLVPVKNVVSEARVEGEDLFVGWTEADTSKVLDRADPAARNTAGTHVAEVLSGALEERFPAARCGVTATEPTLLVNRRCDGWTITARMGAQAGQRDAIVVRGPSK
jgi:hypothetical protein